MLEVREVSHHYKIGDQSLPVLSNVSLFLEKGEMAAIQGPSGSGKSTLLYLVGCLQKVQSGRILIDGENVAELSEHDQAVFRNRKLGFIFQQFHLLPRATVLENILLPAHYPSETANIGKAERQRAGELAALVGLQDRLDHRPNQLSGGQQQRVAIARALMNEPALILADEPTGNLDSKSSAQIMDLLRELNSQGRTILIITHDGEVAAKCKKVHHIRDGRLTEPAPLDPPAAPEPTRPPKRKRSVRRPSIRQAARLARSLLPVARENLARNKIRTFLTMLGITIGIAAVLAMITLGQFTKWKILDSYADLGVNTMNFYGYRNWEMRATDEVPGMFQSFDWDGDIAPLPRIFPEVERITPVLMHWDAKFKFGGKEVEREGRLVGVNHHGLAVMNRELMLGRNFSPYHIENRGSVCIVGSEIAERLLGNIAPLGQVLAADSGQSSFSCKVIGILRPTSSNKEWAKPNLQVIVPYTYFAQVVREGWYTRLHNVLIQVRHGSDVEQVGRGIRAFFEMKYGNSGRFRVDSDSVLVSQMKKFLTLFTVLLTFIALISLAVGGIGIANMMLVSVSERYREIGLRKALGASPASIRTQLLLESLLICCIGGVLGIAIGLAAYHGIIFGASKLIPQLAFEWTIDWAALFLSVVAIALVGLLSGLFPALKAEQLQVIDALRSE
jgi:macrolide transport system ATP-binding/permease protein